MLTIIIPHYKSVNTLLRLLDSIPNRPDEIQVIVVDDNSDLTNDEYSTISERLEQINGKLLLNDTGKKSAGVCRNIGLSNSEGEWILFADADDFFLEGFYDDVSKYFSTSNDIVFFLLQVFSMTQKKLQQDI